MTINKMYTLYSVLIFNISITFFVNSFVNVFEYSSFYYSPDKNPMLHPISKWRGQNVKPFLNTFTISRLQDLYITFISLNVQKIQKKCVVCFYPKIFTINWTEPEEWILFSVQRTTVFAEEPRMKITVADQRRWIQQ